jgi:hypothetical protein
VEGDGGIGDGALGLEEFLKAILPEGAVVSGLAGGEEPVTDGPIPVEPDGGIGDGAGPIGDDGDGIVTILPYPYSGDGEPIPVEPDGGIGDGAGPIGDDGDGLVTILPYPYPGDGEPIPVEPDGGIGDGAGPIGDEPDFDTFTGTEGVVDQFVFAGDHGYDLVTGFTAGEDRIDLSAAEYGFDGLEDVIARATEFGAPDDSEVYGTYIETGDGSGFFLEGVAVFELGMVDFTF